MMDANWIVAIATAALVLVTAYYAKLTKKISEANARIILATENSVRMIREQTEAIFRPYIEISHSLDSHTLITLFIKNTGKTDAKNLQLKVNKEFYIIGRNKISEINAFQFPIKSFPPGARLKLPLMSSAAVSRKVKNDPKMPLEFNITATYSYANRQVEETTTIDLCMYDGTFLPGETIQDKLEKIDESLKIIAKKKK
jgi:hypothetical protein